MGTTTDSDSPGTFQVETTDMTKSEESPTTESPTKSQDGDDTSQLDVLNGSTLPSDTETTNT